MKLEREALSLPFYSIGQEIAHSIIHGIGALGAIAGLVLLTLKANGSLNGYRASNIDIIAVILFTATMTIMFLASTMYHAVQHKDAKIILRKIDHAVIFVFIAGSYTPYCLSAIKGTLGWSLLAAEWSLALLGIILNILDIKALRKIEVTSKILMGWAIVIGFVPLVHAVPMQSIILLIVGGIIYTIGTLWYRRKDLWYTHIVWHAFVFAGAVCHYLSIWYLVSNPSAS